MLSATAFNNERLESPAVSATLTAGKGQEPKFWLFTVGIDKYLNPRMNLNYARADAEALEKFFASGGKIYDKAQTVTLKDNQATKTAIVDGVRALRKIPPQDVVIIYLAGHGDGVGDDWFFIPHEVDGFGADAGGKSLSARELKLELEAVGANRVFLIIDACRSGKALDPIKNYRGMKALRMMARDVGVHVLAATDRDQLAAELQDLGHGVFTYALLKALEGQADKSPANGMVSAREAMGFVEQNVPRLSQRYADRRQFPSAHSRGVDFDVARDTNK